MQTNEKKVKEKKQQNIHKQWNMTLVKETIAANSHSTAAQHQQQQSQIHLDIHTQQKHFKFH